MPHSTLLPPGAVQTSINYYNDEVYGSLERHVEVYMSTKSFRQKYDPRPVTIKDIRDSDEDFKLDTAGFAFVPFPEGDIPQHDPEQLRKEIYPKVEELLKKHAGATSVSVYTHLIRNAPYKVSEDLRNAEEVDEEKIIAETHPAMFAHCDQSYKGGYITLDLYKRLEALWGRTIVPDLEAKGNNRWGVINVWVPIKPINREPLAVCDARTVDEADLRSVINRVVADMHPTGKDFEAEYWQVVANPKHQWYWASNMAPNEALLIKCFDTKLEGVARRALHSAFKTPSDHGPPRESIEFRCFVFWEDQDRE